MQGLAGLGRRRIEGGCRALVGEIPAHFLDDTRVLYNHRRTSTHNAKVLFFFSTGDQQMMAINQACFRGY